MNIQSSTKKVYCTICNDEIILGQNGCTMYSTCTKCIPINYSKKSIKSLINSSDGNDYESLCICDDENWYNRNEKKFELISKNAWQTEFNMI